MGSWIGAIGYHNILLDWKRESNVKTLMVKVLTLKVPETDTSAKKLIIYTEHPGALIGRAGERIDRYKKLLQEEDDHIQDVELVEVDLIVDGNYKIDIEAETADYFRARGF